RELRDLEQRRRDLRARRTEVAAKRDAVVARQQQLEDNLAATERRRSNVSARLYGGTVSASRDLQAMAAEVDALSVRASQLEDEALGVLEEREPLDADVGALDAEDDALARQEADASADLATAEAEVRAELEELAERRAGAAGSVPPDLLAAYDRLRARLGGVGAAPLVGDRCSGCHLTLPATELDRIRHLPPDELVTCDQCGRILVR
ncbi:MAG: zinc ribbon domain-containing protein, partial [Acidimicrobiales bacterium]